MRFLRLGDRHPMNGWHMLAIVGLFFGTIIAVNAVMAVLATATFPGLVVGNSYVASQQYNALLAAAREQEAAGWQAALSVSRGRLQLDFRDVSGAAVPGLDLTATAGRPSTAREDRVVAFREAAAGLYESTGPLPAGRWEVDIEMRRGGDLLFRAMRSVFVAPEAPAP